MVSPQLIGTKRTFLETKSSTAIVEIAKVEAPTTQKRSKRSCLDQTSKEEDDDISL